MGCELRVNKTRCDALVKIRPLCCRNMRQYGQFYHQQGSAYAASSHARDTRDAWQALLYQKCSGLSCIIQDWLFKTTSFKRLNTKLTSLHLSIRVLLQMQPIRMGLKDPHHYVRRTAVMGVLKVYHLDQALVRNAGQCFLNTSTSIVV